MLNRTDFCDKEVELITRYLGAILLSFLLLSLATMFLFSPSSPTQTKITQIGPGTFSCKSINNIRCVDETNSAGWAGSDVCAQIASAIADLSSAGGVVDARGVLTNRSCAANPFSSVSKPITLLLPGVTFTLKEKWTAAANDVVIRGTGERSTVLVAGTLTNSAVVELGDNTNIYFGVRLEDLRVNCNLNAGCTGILIRGLNEESAIKRVLVSHYLDNGIKIDGASQGTQNFAIEDSEVTTAAPTNAAGDGIQFVNAGGNISVRRVSVVASKAQTSAAIHHTASSTSDSFEVIHCEEYTDCILHDGGAASAFHIWGFANTKNTIHLKTNVASFLALDLMNNKNSATNPVVLNELSVSAPLSLSSQNPPSPGGAVPFYSFSDGATRKVESWLDSNGWHAQSNDSTHLANLAAALIGAGSAITSSGVGGTLASANTSQSFTATQTFNQGLVSAGKAAGLSGTGACATITSQVGGSWSGSFKCTGTTGASTVTIRPGTTAPNGWSCSSSDLTAGTAGAQSGSSTTSCQIKFASVTQNDVVTFSANAY